MEVAIPAIPARAPRSAAPFHDQLSTSLIGRPPSRRSIPEGMRRADPLPGLFAGQAGLASIFDDAASLPLIPSMVGASVCDDVWGGERAYVKG